MARRISDSKELGVWIDEMGGTEAPTDGAVDRVWAWLDGRGFVWGDDVEAEKFTMTEKEWFDLWWPSTVDCVTCGSSILDGDEHGDEDGEIFCEECWQAQD